MRVFIVVFFLSLITSCTDFNSNNLNDGNLKNQELLDSINYNEIIIPELETRSIKKYFKKFVSKRRFNGHIVVAKKGKIIFDTTAGFANVRRKIRLKKNSVIQLASVTKPITAAVILQLVEEGKLNLQDTITRHLSNLPDYYNKITIKQLLVHRSGLSPYPYYCHDMIDNKSNLIYNDTVLCVISFHNPKPYYTPGKKYNYCNTNYMLLASIIENIEKKRYMDVMDERIIQKCNMENSFVIDAKKTKKPSNLVLGHTSSNKTFELDYLDGVVGDKGFFSNAKDILQFDRMLSRGKIISDSIAKVAFTPQNKIRHNKSYGFGWRIKMHSSLGKIIYHTGWWHGNRNIYIKIPKNDYTIIILSNSIRGSAYNLSHILNEFDFTKRIHKKM